MREPLCAGGFKHFLEPDPSPSPVEGACVQSAESAAPHPTGKASPRDQSLRLLRTNNPVAITVTARHPAVHQVVRSAKDSMGKLLRE